MTKSRVLAAVAAIVLATGLVVFDAPAQRAGNPPMGPQPGSPRVAMLDLSYIFKNHTRFKARMAEMKADFQETQKWIKRETDESRKIAESLKDFRPGTQEYKQLEKQLVKRRAELQAQMQLQQKDFLQREAKIYHDVYSEVLQQVEYLARRNGYTMVLKFNGEQVNRESPEEVLRDINKSVLWFDNRSDITGLVLEQLNRRGAGTVGDRRAAPAGIPSRPPR